jgi:hypothetical protein
MSERPRFKKSLPRRDRVSSLDETKVREQASHLPPGLGRDDLLRKARQAETASHFDDWTSSPGLGPPK